MIFTVFEPLKLQRQEVICPSGLLNFTVGLELCLHNNILPSQLSEPPKLFGALHLQAVSLQGLQGL